MLLKKYSTILLISLSFCLNINKLLAPNFRDFMAEFGQEIWREMQREGREFQEKWQREQQRIQREKQRKQDNIRQRKEDVYQQFRAGRMPEAEMKQRLADLDKEEQKITAEEEKDLEFFRNLENKATDFSFDLMKGAKDYIFAEANAEQKLKEVAVQAAVTQKEANKGLMERFEKFIKDLPKFGWVACGSAAGLATIYYGGKLSYNYLDAKIGKPDLIRESTCHDWKHGIKTWWNESILGRVPEEISLKEVILTPEMSAKMQMLADDAKSSIENGLPFRHVLFYGLPGTGKTMFAKRLARYSDIDYAIMSGADFAQFKNGEGITELHKLFDWAENSKNGLLIFIDEAEAFLRDRRVLDNDGRNLVNAFLSRTGEGSDKFMIVLASNYEDELDPAVLSRVHKKINFPLPATPEREKMLKMYFDKYIVNDSRRITKDDQDIELSIEVAKDVENNLIHKIAEDIEGFSGREIEQLASEVRVASYNIGKGRLTKDILTEVVGEKVKEHKHDMEAVKFQKERMDAALKQNKLIAAT